MVNFRSQRQRFNDALFRVIGVALRGIALLGGTLNIVHEQVCTLVDFKPIEESSTVELGVERQQPEQLLMSSPVCSPGSIDTAGTPSVFQTDALKMILNNEVKEDLLLKILTKIAQSISGKCVWFTFSRLGGACSMSTGGSHCSCWNPAGGDYYGDV